MKHLIVISVDALVYEDLEYASTLPNFRMMLDQGSVIERVRTIYPSLTHPVHASIISGAPAGVTGIISNEVFAPGTYRPHWYNELSQIKCDTLLHAAKRAGVSTAVCSWPVTSGKGDIIDYLVPCVLNYSIEGRESEALEVYRECGMTENVADIVDEGLRRYGCLDVHPSIDEFQTYCSCEIIKRYKPGLLLTHPSYVDSVRHKFGLFTDKVKLALEETDRWLGMIFSAVREAEIESDTDFILLSDHGHLTMTRNVSPNVVLCDRGYIRKDEDGQLKDFDAYVKNCGLSAYVYLNDPENYELKSEIYQLLTEMKNDGIYGISDIITREQALAEYGLDGDFSFVLEGDGYSRFTEGLERPIAESLPGADVTYSHSSHGHRPERGPQPTFIAMGPSFKQGVVIHRGSILSHAPTIAKVLGLELKDAVGKSIDKILI